MKAATLVKERILRRGPNSLWSFRDFPNLPHAAVAKSLSRLAKSGIIVRTRKGIYFYPKRTALGPSVPGVMDVINKSLRNSKNSITFSGGLSSFHSLGITTQVPANYSILSNRAIKEIVVGN